MCLVMLLLLHVVDIDAPYFTGLTNYFRMYFDDSIYWKFVFNSFSIPIVCCITMCFILYLNKILLFKYRHRNIANPIFFPAAFLVLAFSFYIPLYFCQASLFRLIRSTDYATHTIINHLIDYQYVKYIRPPFINLPLFLISIWMGIFICFLFWPLEQLILKQIKKRIAEH